MQLEKYIDNKTLMIQIDTISILDYFLLFVFCLLIVGLIFFLCNPIYIISYNHPSYFTSFLYCIIFAISFVFLYFLEPRKAFITLYKEEELVHCTLHNFFGKKIKDYKFLYSSVKDIEIIEERHKHVFTIKFVLKNNTEIIVINGVGVSEANRIRKTIINFFQESTYNNQYE